jgi:hypothetical protein
MNSHSTRRQSAVTLMSNSQKLLAACLLGVSASLLAGCNWSTSLAVETEKTTESKSGTPATAAETASPVPSTGNSPVTKTPDAATSQAVPAEEESSTELQPKLEHVDPRQLVGTWQDSFFGTRTLTLNADGTAQMTLELDFAGRLLYGRRLDFDMQWSVEAGRVTINILAGRPAKSAKSAMNTWGSRYVYLLDCVEDKQIEMRDSDGSMNHRLQRVPDDETSEPK